jgi:hypothetical protein
MLCSASYRLPASRAVWVWARPRADLQPQTADCEAPASLGPPLDYDAAVLHAGDFRHLGRAAAIGRAGDMRADADLAGRQLERADDGLIIAHRPGVCYAPEPAKDDDIPTCNDLGARVQIADQGNVTRVLQSLSRSQGSPLDDA